MFTFYTVKNKDNGKYLCRVPHSKKEVSNPDLIWTDNFSIVKVYSNPGPARGAITTITRLCCAHDISKPNIALVQLDTTETILDEQIRVSKAVAKIQTLNEQQEANSKNYQIQMLQKRIEDDVKRLNNLKNS